RDHRPGCHRGGPRDRGRAARRRQRQPPAGAARRVRGAVTSTAAPFGARLRRAVAERGNLCVGIDPHPALLEAWGLGVDAAGVAVVSRRSLEAFGDRVPAVKPQVAFFEEHGSAGFRVLEELLSAIGERGALSVADAKRGDIGSTMAGYARAWLRDA